MSLYKQEELKELITKYGGAVPRYTSYPTAPEWKHPYDHKEFETAIVRSNDQGNDYSLYLHLPFCESQCYFCGCNVVISKEHGMENQYLDHLKQELEYLGSQIDKKRKLVQMAWGGGTPTYLTCEQIDDLMLHIAKHFNLAKKDDKYEYAVEVDPRITTKEQLAVLFKHGFNRISMGVQDFNLETQENINRIQPYEMIEKLLKEAREVGFRSINFDLIYGLPHQTLETFEDTIAKVKTLNPERIALFNYAHIPSMLPFQRKYIKDETLPNQELKLEIFDKALEEFTAFGYEFIGIDHFAKPDDELAVALKNKTLYRNFQGFTTYSGCDLYGAGLTAISDIAGVYKQNPKKLNDYYEQFLNTYTAEKFMLCSADDIERRSIIKQIMCNHAVVLDKEKYATEIVAMDEFIADKLLTVQDADPSELAKQDCFGEGNFVNLQVTDFGQFFVRNIASEFDTYLRQDSGHKVFSKAL